MTLLTHPRTLPLLVAGTFFMEFLDGTVIATALPAMAGDFGLRPVDLSVGVSAYLFTLALLLPASGWAAERFGARRVFCTAVGVFTLASVACGLSTGLASFTLARIVQGAGGALMVPVGRLAVLRATAKPDLMRAIATLTWPALVAPVIAPPLGGFIVTAASWRWIFFINLPLGAFALWLAFRVMPPERAGSLRAFDARGFALVGSSLLALLAAVELLGRDSADWTLVLACGSAAAALGVPAWRHLGRHPAPILRLDGFAVRSFAVCMGGGTLFRTAVGAVPFLLPLLFQVGFGFDAFRSGLLVLALFLGNVGMKPLTTAVLRRFGFKRVMTGSACLAAAAILSLATLSPATPLFATLPILVLAGATRSLGLTTINTLAFADIAPDAMGGANTLFNMGQQLGFGFGVALGAVALRIGEAWRPAGALHATPAEFRVAFALVGVAALAAAADALRLPADAGAEVARAS